MAKINFVLLEDDNASSCRTRVLIQNERTQTALIKKLCDYLYDLHAGAHLMEEAQYDLNTFNDERRLLAAERWIKMHFQPDPHRGLLGPGAIPEDVVDCLVRFVERKNLHVLKNMGSL